MRAALGVAACVLLAGCASDPRRGYSFESTFATDIRTISVPMFDNYTYSPELSAEVTEAVIKELQRTTPWAVTSSANADTTLTGVVTSAELRKLSADRNTGFVQELATRVVVDFEWVDNRTGKVLSSRRGFAGLDTFVPARPTGERIEVGQRGAVQTLARDLVSQLRSGW